MSEWTTHSLPLIGGIVHFLSAMAVTVDAVLRKRHVQAVISWVGIAWLVPILGAAAYACFGVNRIRRRATALNVTARRPSPSGSPPALPEEAPPAGDQSLPGLARLAERVTGERLSAGNAIVPLDGGDAAFPEMLDCIAGARRSLGLQTYIFDADAVGLQFVEALAAAHDRGVEVRVLIDDIGARYSRPRTARLLKARGVPVATFLPTHVPRLFRYANLRNHRKILVVDGRTGFTGGMNLRAGHWLTLAPRHPVRCLHFRVEGPLVRELMRTFAMDWNFTTGETLDGPLWFPAPVRAGNIVARGIPDGPDESLGSLPDIMLGALACARQRVRIVTPYFLPDEVLLRALHVTALRGVDVAIVLPARSNVPLVDWAMQPQLGELLSRGCRIFLSPPPFDHAKLFVVDGCWSLIGSANWDARSLRLNFEYNIECYDGALAAHLEALVEARIRAAQRLTTDRLDTRPALRLRNGLARLLSPYL